MNFGSCNDCGKYKYLRDGGACPSCDDSSEVRILLDMLNRQIREPDTMRAVADGIESNSAVYCTGDADEFEEEKHDDLDVKVGFCRLYEAEEMYKYDDYTGSFDERVRKAVVDALSDAERIYGD